jgi:hypothetical protein
MKCSTLCFLFLFSCLFSSGQTPDGNLQDNEQIIIKLEGERAETPLTNFFSHVRVIDARDDTSEVGYYSTGAEGRKWPKLYRISPSAKEGIAEWVTNYLGIKTEDASSSATLLIVLKKLWLSSAAVAARKKYDQKVQPKEQGFDPGLVTKLEVYLEKESTFYPMFKIDSIFTYNKSLSRYAGFYFTESLKQSLQRLFRIDFNEVLNKGRKLSSAELEAYNRKGLAAQILNTRNYKKGVYKSFAEFKANTPSISEYELRSGAMGDVLYVKENGSEYPMRSAWGFSDGTRLYINSCDKYWRLIRKQNTFYFAGIKGIEREAEVDLLQPQTGPLLTRTVFSTTTKYYQVDMATGEVY